MPYVKITGASGNISGTGGNSNFTHATTSSDNDLTNLSYGTIANGYWLGNGDSSETHTHAFSQPVGGARITFNAFDPTEYIQIVLDGQVLDLNTAISDGSVTLTGPFVVNANNEVSLGAGGNGSTTGVLTINLPFTSFAVINAPVGATSGNGIIYDLEVESDPGPDYIVEGTSGDDVIDDLYALDPEGDAVDASDAADGSNDDYIQAGAGNDSVDAGLGDDSVVGDTGNDTLNGEDGNDTLVGDDELDSDNSVRSNPMAGPGGNDVLFGGAGEDSLYGGSGNDSLYGGDGDDSLLGGHGDDLLEGGAGNDELEGLYGDDTIFGGDGNDHVFGRDGADLIYGGDGVDSLIGSIGIDTLYGGAGNDILAGSQGSDLIYGGEGDDLVYIGVPAAGDIAYDNEGTVYLDEGNDYLDAGDATLKFEAYGGDGNDIMNSGVGNDTLYGGADDDQIYAGAGDDKLNGDGGDDYIEGQSGDDTFDLDNNFGFDTLVGGETGETNGDTLDASTITADIVLDLSNGDAADPEDGTLSVDPTGGAGASPAVHYVRIFKPDAAVTGFGVYPSGAIDFSAGEWFYVPVSDMDISLHDSQGINGGGGGVDTSQTIMTDFDGLTVAGDGIGAAGKSEYLDANGNPFFVGWVSSSYGGPTGFPGQTYLIVTDAGGGEPNGAAASTGFTDANAQFDYSSFTPPVHIAEFSEIENVILGSGDDSVIGSEGDDVVATGAGADTVMGGQGNDTFDLGATDGDEDVVVLSDGDGNDSITHFEAPIDNGDGTFDGRDQLDVSGLTSDAGTTPVNTSNVVVSDTNGDGTGDAILTFPGGESITLVGVPATRIPDAAALEAMGIPAFVENYIVEGTSGADTIDYTYVADPEGDRVDNADNATGDDADNIQAGAGNDSIWSYFGDDTIYGGEGDDWAAGGDGADLLLGESGDDELNGGEDSDTLYGGIGSDTLYGDNGDDMVYGGDGGDSLIGGYGNDTLEGQDGDDTIFGVHGDDIADGGAGDDVLHGEVGNDSLIGNIGNDSLYGGVGADSLFGGDGMDYLAGGADSDSIVGGAGADDLDGDAGDDALYGGDGNDNLDGGAGADLVYGGIGADSVYGAAGDDTLYGEAGIDAIYGGTGNDSIFGGAGGDYIALSGGNDTVSAGDDDDNINVTAGTPAMAGTTSITVDGGTGGADSDTLNLTSFDFYRNLTQTPDADADSTSGTVEVQNSSGNWITVTFTEIENLNLPAPAPNYIVEGTAGNDLINAAYMGDPEGDRVDANDNLAGNNNDSIVAGAGNDTVIAGAGDDNVDGGIGNDSLLGGAGGDTLFGGAGNDTLFSGGSSGGPSMPDSGPETDELHGGDGSDYVSGDNSADVLYGDDGNDQLRGYGGDDTFYGGLGDDVMISGAGNDVLIDMDGNNMFLGDVGNESMVAGDGNDLMYGDLTGDINGGADTMSGGGGNDSIYGEYGDDVINGEAGNDNLAGGAGNDSITGGAGADTLNGGAGDDDMVGDAGDDVFVLADGFGTDDIAGSETGETVGDTLDASAMTADSVLDLSVGNPGDAEDGRLSAGGNIASFQEIENVILGSGDDSVTGSSGDDNVATGAGADTVDGGAGDDSFALGADGVEDIVRLGDGDGHDTLSGFDAPVDNGDGTFAGVDQLDVSTLFSSPGQPVNVTDVVVSDDGAGNAVLTFPNGEAVTLMGVDPLVADTPAYLMALGIPSNYVVDGTSGAEVIDGSYSGDPEGDMIDAADNAAGNDDDVVRAGAGDDSVFSGVGDDEIYGDAGNDLLQTGTGDDTIYGGDGNDRIFAENGQDVVYGGAGNDSTYASVDGDLVYGGAGNDSLQGGGLSAGPGDTLHGDDGNDTLNGGGANDVLYGGADSDVLQMSGTLDADTLVGGEAGVDRDTVDLGTVSQGVDVAYSGNEAGTITDGVETAVFSEIEAFNLTGFDDTLDGSLSTDGLDVNAGAGEDSITGGSGNDTIIGETGDDVIDGGLGDDSIRADEGDDTVTGGAGNDTIYGFEGSDSVDGGGGDDFINTRTSPGTGLPDQGYSGLYPADTDPNNDRDTVLGGAGNDTILTGDDDDLVFGGTGADSIDAGFDDDTIDGGAGADTIIGSEGNDSIDGGAGDDVLYGGLETGVLDISSIPDATDLLPGNGLDTIHGGDGDDLIYGMDDADEVYGDAGNDTVYGGIDNDSVYGGAGADSLSGDDGDDSVDGGVGDDTLSGGAGNDTLLGSDGDDTIDGGVGDDLIHGDNPTLVAAGGAPPTSHQFGLYALESSGVGAYYTNGTFAFDGAAAAAPISVTDDDGALEDQNTGGGSPIDAGTPQILTSAVTIGGVTYPAGTAVYAIAQSDIYNANTGETGNAWVIQLGTSTPGHFYSYDIAVNSGDMLTWTSSNTIGVQSPIFADVTGLNYVDLEQASGSFGASYDDSLSGDAGNDTIYGGLGSDTVDGGDGDDSLYGGDGNDELVGGNGNDVVDGGAGDDYIEGGLGADTLNGGLGDDYIEAGEGNDSVYGDEGNDTLDGESGNDRLYGGDGDDTVEGNDGNDTLYGGAGNDVLQGGYDRDVFFGGIGDTIDGGEGGDDFDVLNLSALGGAAMTNVIYGGGNNEAGTVDVLDAPGGNVVGSFTFSNIESVIPCFTPGAMIHTDKGERPVETLKAGDRVLTRDNGYQTIRWVGSRRLSSHDLAAQPNFNPVRIRAGALGENLPMRDMTVSPQHRMLVSGPRAEILFGEHEVLVAAVHMVNDRTVVRAWPQEVTYIHLLFDRHEIIRADGAWTESFQPGDQTVQSMSSAQRAELVALFPQLDEGEFYPAARVTLKGFEAKILMQQ